MVLLLAVGGEAQASQSRSMMAFGTPRTARIASSSCSVVVLPAPTGPIRRIARAMA
jgi:hypothetical protein